MPLLQFRGVELRAWNGKIEEAGPVHRLKFLADMSRPVARALGVEQLLFEGEEETMREIEEDLSIKGHRRITSFKLDPNGMKQHAIELTGTDLEYEIYTKAGKEEDDPKEAHIRISIATGDPFRIVEEYAKVAGQAKAVLKVKLAADQQMKLDEQIADEEEEAESGEGDGDGPALASVVEMHGNPKKKRSTAPVQ